MGSELVALDDDREPWARQRGETAAAFGNFVVYRELLAKRSLRAAAEQLGKHVDTLDEQSVKYKWVERAEAYDNYLDKRYRDMREGEVDRLAREDAEIGRQLKLSGLRRLRGDPDEVPAEHRIAAVDMNRTEIPEVIRMITEGSRLQRLALGQPTDIAKLTGLQDEARKLAVVVVEIALKYVPDELAGPFIEELRSLPRGR